MTLLEMKPPPLLPRLTAAFFDAAAARRDWKAREEDLRAARLELRRSLESAWSDWAARADRVAVQNQFLAAIEQQNSEASIRYASELMSFENWEQVVTDLVNVERSALQAERDAAVAEAAWRNARGVPLEDQ
jgi:outer membrane protein TolC